MMNTKPRVTRRSLLASAAASPMAAPIQASSQAQHRSAQLTPVGVATAATVTAPACTPTNPLAPLEPTLSQFTSTRSTLQSTQPLSQRLDIGIDFSETVLNQPDNNNFRYHQVEQLISQAATLLERGIASRSEWQNLYERYFVTYLEVKEFDDLDAIHAEETLHGFYALPQNSAETDAKVQEIIRNGWVKTVTTGEDISSYANAQMNSADEQLTNADFRKNYEQCNVGFRRRRTESARRMNVIKAIGFTQPGAAYNYAERMVPIKARFTIDFNDAINRMRAIKIGLKKTYNYEMKVIDDTSNPFDNALLSIRDAMEWLVKFTSQEQNYVLAVSVKSTARDAWDSGLSDDKISGVWKFRLNNSMFPQQLFVRLRGLALSVETEDQRAIFQALIKVPPQGEVHYFDAGADTQIDQTRVPPVRIGRVQRQDSVRAPDVVGTVSLQNVSPIGEWELAVTAGQIPLSNWSHPNTIDPHLIRRNAQIEDVVLYLYLAVRAST